MAADASKFDRVAFRLRTHAATALAQARTAYWRILGMQIGSSTLLPRVRATWPHQVSLGANCSLEHDIYFKFDGIWAPGPSMLIGDRVFIGFGCELNVRRKITIGSDCLIASGCKFIDHDHGTSRRDVFMREQADGVEGEIVIGNDVWLGANVVVLKGVQIGRGAIVAAGAIVTKNIADYEIWGGVPARKLAERSP